MIDCYCEEGEGGKRWIHHPYNLETEKDQYKAGEQVRYIEVYDYTTFELELYSQYDDTESIPIKFCPWCGELLYKK